MDGRAPWHQTGISESEIPVGLRDAKQAIFSYCYCLLQISKKNYCYCLLLLQAIIFARNIYCAILQYLLQYIAKLRYFKNASS